MHDGITSVKECEILKEENWKLRKLVPCLEVKKKENIDDNIHRLEEKSLKLEK